MPRSQSRGSIIRRVIASDAVMDSLGNEAVSSMTDDARMAQRPKALIIFGEGLLRGEPDEGQGKRTSLELVMHPALDQLVRDGSMSLVAFHGQGDNEMSQVLGRCSDEMQREGRLVVSQIKSIVEQDGETGKMARDSLALLWGEGGPEILMLLLRQEAWGRSQGSLAREGSIIGLSFVEAIAQELLSLEMSHLSNNTLISVLLTCNEKDAGLNRSSFPAATLPAGATGKQLSNAMEPAGGSKIDLGALVLSPLSSSDMTTRMATASNSSSFSIGNDIITRPVQAWEAEQNPTLLNSPGLLAQRLPGRIRRDKCTSLSYLESHYRGGQLCVDACRLIHNISFLTSRMKTKEEEEGS